MKSKCLQHHKTSEILFKFPLTTFLIASKLIKIYCYIPKELKLMKVK